MGGNAPLAHVLRHLGRSVSAARSASARAGPGAFLTLGSSHVPVGFFPPCPVLRVTVSRARLGSVLGGSPRAMGSCRFPWLSCRPHAHLRTGPRPTAPDTCLASQRAVIQSASRDSAARCSCSAHPGLWVWRFRHLARVPVPRPACLHARPAARLGPPSKLVRPSVVSSRDCRKHSPARVVSRWSGSRSAGRSAACRIGCLRPTFGKARRRLLRRFRFRAHRGERVAPFLGPLCFGSVSRI